MSQSTKTRGDASMARLNPPPLAPFAAPAQSTEITPEQTADAAATTGSGTTINVTGGTSITVVSNAVVGAADNDGDAFTIGAIGVTGDASTTSVSVTQTAAAAYSETAGKIAIVNGAVTIADKNAGLGSIVKMNGLVDLSTSTFGTSVLTIA